MAVNIGRNTIRISSFMKMAVVFIIATANFILEKMHKKPNRDAAITNIKA